MSGIRVLCIALAAIVSDAKRLTSVQDSNTSQTGFSCPSECQHCCTAHAYDIGIAAWGVSESKFKCILSDHEVKPSGCADPEQRTHSSNQYKTECPFAAESLNMKPWEELEKTPCPQVTKCCCDQDDAWTETKCLDVTSSHTKASSEDARAKGVQQTYEKQRYNMYENKGGCVSDRPQLKWQKNRKGSLSTHGRCCIVLETKTEKVATNCGLRGGYPCDEMECSMDSNCFGGANWCGEKNECDYKDVEWVACKKFEPLYYCSADGGLTHNGQTNYKRVPTATGVCNPSGECPTGWGDRLLRNKCVCNEDCGAR